MARSKRAESADSTSAAASPSAAAEPAGRSNQRERQPAPRRRSPETVQTITDTAHDLWCDAERSARYHGARASFFDLWHRILMLLVFLSGSAAAVSAAPLVADQAMVTVVLALIPALAAAIEFACDLTGKARVHAGLRSRFTVLAGEIDPSETERTVIAGWRQGLYRIYADEPPAVYYGVNAAAHNAVSQVVGADQGQMQRIGFWRGLIIQWRTFRPTDFPRFDAVS